MRARVGDDSAEQNLAGPKPELGSSQAEGVLDVTATIRAAAHDDQPRVRRLRQKGGKRFDQPIHRLTRLKVADVRDRERGVADADRPTGLCPFRLARRTEVSRVDWYRNDHRLLR